MKKIYVGNLAYEVQEDELKDLFTKCGEVVSANIIIDRSTGRSKGFGFVEFESPAQAEAAIEELNGQEFQGRPLKVNMAREQQRSGGGRGGDRGNRQW